METMKPKRQRSNSYNEHDLAVADCASEFDEVIGNQFDLIDFDTYAEVNDDDDEEGWV